MVLDEGENCGAFRGKIRNHVRVSDDDLPVQDVVVCVVAAVDDVGEVDHHACSVALTVDAGIRLIGRDAVVSQKFRLALAIDYDASAGAFHL